MSFIALSLFTSCSTEDDLTPSCSYRDWTYPAEQVEVYIDGVKQAQVSKITVSSAPLWADSDSFPWYTTTLKVKGLVSKKKITEIVVDADLDRFEGHTEISGVQYAVTGVFTGNPFEDHSTQGIIAYLETE